MKLTIRKKSISGTWLAFWLSVILILAFFAIAILVMIEKVEANQYQWDQELKKTTYGMVINTMRLSDGD